MPHQCRLDHSTLGIDAWEWRLDAQCRAEDPSLFFHPDGERGKARRQRQQAAKEVCARCRVIVECQAHAVAFNEAFGIWGGISEEERMSALPGRVVRIRTHRTPQINAHEPHGSPSAGLAVLGYAAAGGRPAIQPIHAEAVPHR
jgi:WhiB family redox-sensing transcriptional regulator